MGDTVIQYHFKTKAVNATATVTTTTATAASRVVDAHSPLHMRASKSAKACDAADVVDGLAVVQNFTLRLAAAAYGVSIGSVARARRLTPEQRQAVRRGERPLILPRTPSAPPVPATPAIPPVIMGPRERLNEIVAEIGLNGVLDLLAVNERAAA
jgi:hypothetical protein